MSALNLEEDLKREFFSISSLPFVKLCSPLKTIEDKVVAFLEFIIEKPSSGICPGINEKEIVGIIFPPGYPSECPTPIVSMDFPYVQHQVVYDFPDGKSFKSICLMRISPQDWWCGKTLFDLILAIHDWLDDAAAGNLVKPDDPFEPLIADASIPVVELNVSEARIECDKHEGFWETTSCLINIPDSTKSRFIIGEGNVKTLVWYQPSEQVVSWIKRPDTLQDLESLVESAGFDRRRFEYWIKKGHDLTNKLIVIGVRRPRSVLGRPDNDEWVAFNLEIDRRTHQLKVQTHLVHQSYTRDLARKLSGYLDTQTVRKILIIGSGALGSSVAEILIRSGHLYVKLIDDDVLQPHNLARHVLGDHDIGSYKAKALVERFNNLYRCEGNVAECICKNLFSLSIDEWANLNNDVDLILDCSASPAVMRYLAESDCRHKPVISAYQIDHGNGTIMLYSPEVENIPLLLIELCCIAQWRSVPIVHRWLVGEQDPIDIGGGCRSASSKISHAKTMFGASIICDQILNWLTSGKSPRVGNARLFNLPSSENEISNILRMEVSSQKLLTGLWTIFIPDSISSKLNKIALEKPTIETGGILVGHTDRQKRHFYVIDCIECGGERTNVGFLRFPSSIRYTLAMMENSTVGMIHYIGEWHSHPKDSGCDPSHVDKRTLMDLANSLIGDRFPAFCAISNGKESAFHIFEHRSREVDHET